MIKWRERLKNKYFWISMISLVVLLLQQLNIELPFDLNEIGNTIVAMLVALGIIVDNGTGGFKDE